MAKEAERLAGLQWPASRERQGAVLARVVALVELPEGENGLRVGGLGFGDRVIRKIRLWRNGDRRWQLFF